MEIKTTACCAIMEIDKLGSHKTPEDAMESFCKLNIAAQVPFGAYRNIPQDGSLYAFYLFTAAVDAKGNGLYSGKAYGAEFAKFIEENKLGKVWASPVKQNQVFHSDHSNQIWIWDTDHEAIKKWWKKRLEAANTKSKVKAPPKVKMCDCGEELDEDDHCPDGCDRDDDYEPDYDENED